jgi:hypothetical protein
MRVGRPMSAAKSCRTWSLGDSMGATARASEEFHIVPIYSEFKRWARSPYSKTAKLGHESVSANSGIYGR